MPIHVQPHPIRADGVAGLIDGFLTEQPIHSALSEWCRKHGAGWFNLRQVSDFFHSSALWSASWPMTDRVVQFVVTKG